MSIFTHCVFLFTGITFNCAARFFASLVAYRVAGGFTHSPPLPVPQIFTRKGEVRNPSPFLSTDPHSPGDRRMLSKFSGKIYPNGEFGVSRVQDAQLSELCPSLPNIEWTQDAWSDDASIRGSSVSHGREYAIASSPILGLSIRSNSHTRPKVMRKPRGYMGISTYGAKLTRSAACLLEREFGLNCLSFATMTLPRMDAEQWKRLLENWSEIVRIFVQKLRRRLSILKLSTSIVGVVEIQSERLITTGEIGLHIHVVFQGRWRFGCWRLTPKDLQEIWSTSVVARIPSLAVVSWNSSTRIERLRKSCEGYLGKYLSKGKSAVAKVPEELRHLLPSSWNICTNELRREFKKRTLSGIDIGMLLISLIDTERASSFTMLRDVVIEFADGFTFTVGYYGRLTKGVLSGVLTAML